MKKLLFIISFIAIAGTATAQHMVVETAGGNEVFTLENLKQITFSKKFGQRNAKPFTDSFQCTNRRQRITL